MGELPAAGGDVGQECGDEVFREPAQRCDGPPCSGQRLVQRMQGGADGPVGAGQQLGQPPVEPAVRALAREPACPACGAAEAEYRAGAGAADGLIQGARPDRPDATAAGAARPPLLAGEAPRLAVSREIPHGALWPQIEQTRLGSGAVPSAGRTGSGRRLYDAGCAARLDLVATLRELGLGLADVRRVLENITTVAEVAAVHVEALDAQIRTLRLRRAVLAAVAKRRPGMEGVTLMNKLAELSAQERKQIIDDFAAEVFHGLDPDPGLAAHLRKPPRT